MANYDYKAVSYLEKINDLFECYKTSSALADALQITRVTLLSWKEHLLENYPEKIRKDNKGNIDLLWCKKILLPSLINEDDKNINIQGIAGLPVQDLLKQDNLLKEFIKKSSFGSLEIELPVKRNNFDMVIEKNITPQNSTVKDVLSMQNIYTLNNKIIQNHLNNPDYIIDTNLIRFWHHTLMSGVIENAGEFSKKIRILPSVDLTLTHPEDIKEELNYWVDKYSEIKSLSDIAMAHSHFELIHPFSDGNGRIGRSIILAQSLKSGFIPPVINTQNKELYYATLEHSQRYSQYTPLALFFRDASKKFQVNKRKKLKI